MLFEIRITRNDGTVNKTEIEANDKMTVAAHIVVDIRSTGYQKSDPSIAEIRYNEKGTTKYRYA